MKKFRIRNSFAVALVFAICIVHAQQIPYLPVDNYFPSIFSHSQIISYPYGITSPTSTTTPVYISGSAQTNFVAGQRVHLHDGFHAGDFNSGGYFRGQVGVAADFDVRFMQPDQNTPDVEQYEKLEMGIHLPQQLFDDVEAFCDETPNYPTPVNPFNPEELNVFAEFYYVLPNFSEQLLGRVYGFYYREFERVEIGPHADWHWDQVNTDYTFRVRFAPSAIGRWKVVIKVESPTRGNYQVGALEFSCVGRSDPNNKGFMKTVFAKRYLSLDGQSFMPIGWNLSNPIPRDLNDYHPGNGPWAWDPINEYGYVDFRNYMQELADAGGNYFRLHTDPWALEIEFEHLNDYSDRLTNAWEMDRILDQAKDMNLYIHFTLSGGNAVMKGNSYWDWLENSADCYSTSVPDNGYCYHSELGLTDPVEFLTDAQAKKFFKYRLRYMISRYGYSRNIAMFELANEVNSFCQAYTPDCNRSLTFYPYGTDNPNNASFRSNIYNWQSEMTSYIKTQLFLHSHILAVNYASYPETGDNSFGLSSIDMNTFNYYDGYLSRVRHYFEYQRDYGFDTYDHPFFFSETGEPNRDLCCNFTEWIRTFWTVPFSGAAGGLNWPNTSFPQNISFYSHFARLRDYIAGTDFNDGRWEPDYQMGFDQLAETIHLKHFNPNQGPNGSFDKAIGVVLNRGYNSFSMRTCVTNCECFTFFPNPESNVFDYPNSPPNFPVQDLSSASGQLKLTHMGVFNHYTVEWMDVLTGSTVLIDDKFTDVWGELELDYPTLIMTAPPIRPILAFKIYPYNGSFSRILPSSELAQQSQNDDLDFTLFPVPTDNNLTITPSCSTCIYNLALTDISGKTIFTISDKTGIQFIDVSFMPNGIYFVTFSSGELVSRKKILIVR